MQIKLTATTIKNLQPESKPYEVVDTQLKGFLLRVQPSGRMTFYYSYRGPSGARKRIKLGVVGSSLTPAQARDEATKHAGEVARGVDVQRAKVAAKVEAQAARLRTLRAFLDTQYKPWALSNQKTGQATLDRIEHNFPKFMALAIEEITVRRVEAWRTDAINKGLAPATINRSVNCLRGALTKAVAWEFLEKHPLEKLKPLKVDKAPKVRFLSEDEESRLFQALEERDKELKEARKRGNQHREERGYETLPDLSSAAYVDRMYPLVTLSLKTGLRRGELFDLLIEDVNLRDSIITVRGGDSKSGHTRHVPLSRAAREVLEKWLQQSAIPGGRVFPSDTGGRLDNVRKSWAAILTKAEISDFRWHDMRHHFASKLVMRGVPLNTVREFCGHSDMNTTLRYAHLAPGHKQDAISLVD